MTEMHHGVDPRRDLERWFRAAIHAVDPIGATQRALEATPGPTAAPAVIAIGKAAGGMARAAVAWLAAHHLEPTGGIVVGDRPIAPPHPAIATAVGDHPHPGQRSLAAARLLGTTVAELPVGTPVEVFLSGGTSALIAAPIAGITAAELVRAFEVMSRAGLDIRTMNALRRQLTRWSGGRLAAALGSRQARAWVISDVIGNDVAVIGSGPLVGGGVDVADMKGVLEHPLLTAELPAGVRRALKAPPPPAARPISHLIVADGRLAGHAAVQAARDDGGDAILHRTPLTGEASGAARAVVAVIEQEIRRTQTAESALAAPRAPVLHVWTGEPTVSIPVDHGLGGRAQQFALAAAVELATGDARRGWPADVTLLVAGTDGRDGPTDAAGAVVDGGTMARIVAGGDDPVRELTRANAYPVLDRVGALLRTGPTGTNVADIVLVWMWNRY